MNVKLISKALHTLSLLSDEDYELVLKFRALTEDERGLLITVLEPQKPATKKASKKLSASSKSPREYDHCLRCGTTKRDSSHKDKSSPDYHEFESEKDIDFCARCKGATEKHPIHHEREFGGYHPFESSGAVKPSKSPRATNLHTQLKSRVSEGREAATRDDESDDDDSYCTHQYEHDGIMIECGEPADQNIHHLSSVEGYHPFVLDAHDVITPSPANGEASSSTANSEIAKDTASTVAHGVSGD